VNGPQNDRTRIFSDGRCRGSHPKDHRPDQETVHQGDPEATQRRRPIANQHAAEVAASLSLELGNGPSRVEGNDDAGISVHYMIFRHCR